MIKKYFGIFFITSIIYPLLLIVCLGGLVRADFFPLIGYDCKRPYGADSCNINTMMFPCDSNPSWMDWVFNAANSLNMKIILAHAWIPGFNWDICIDRFSSGQWSAYEAEAGSFGHDMGGMINDPAASGGKAWAVCDTQTGLMQKGPGAVEPFYYWWPDLLGYSAYFRLKTNNKNQASVLCTLSVWNNDTVLKGFSVIRGTDFPAENVYYDTLFKVRFKMGKNEACHLDFNIRYMGTNDSLYSDKVDVLDEVANSLKNGRYDHYIQRIAGHYGSKSAMFRYYMFDEPSMDQYWSSKEVNLKLKAVDQTKGGVQALYDQGFFDTYLVLTNADELMIDYYPLWGKRCSWGDPTPKDSGSLFQANLDNMCNLIGTARKSVKTHNKKLWFIPQTFGHGYCAGNTYQWDPVWNVSIPYDDEGLWREPTPRELRCMVWLSLAYGVKGICYFIYQSAHEFNQSQHFWICGLTDSVGMQRRPSWYTTREINGEIEKLAPLLLSLESDTVFKASVGIPPDCFIKSVKIWDTPDTLIQLGTFHKKGDPDDKYFIIVNRHCLPSESLEVAIGFEDKLRYLYDCYTKEKITYEFAFGNPTTYVYRIKLKPGQGKLFRALK